MYLTGVGVPEKLLTGVKVTVPSVALVYVPCPAMVTTPSLTEHVGVVGVSGQESTNELGTKDAPEPAESLVPATLKTPDFRIPTEVYSVENHAKWSAKDEWFYNFEEIQKDN